LLPLDRTESSALGWRSSDRFAAPPEAAGGCGAADGGRSTGSTRESERSRTDGGRDRPAPSLLAPPLLYPAASPGREFCVPHSTMQINSVQL